MPTLTTAALDPIGWVAATAPFLAALAIVTAVATIAWTVVVFRTARQADAAARRRQQAAR